MWMPKKQQKVSCHKNGEMCHISKNISAELSFEHADSLSPVSV